MRRHGHRQEKSQGERVLYAQHFGAEGESRQGSEDRGNQLGWESCVQVDGAPTPSSLRAVTRRLGSLDKYTLCPQIYKHRDRLLAASLRANSSLKPP